MYEKNKYVEMLLTHNYFILKITIDKLERSAHSRGQADVLLHAIWSYSRLSLLYDQPLTFGLTFVKVLPSWCTVVSRPTAPAL